MMIWVTTVVKWTVPVHLPSGCNCKCNVNKKMGLEPFLNLFPTSNVPSLGLVLRENPASTSRVHKKQTNFNV